METGNDDSDEPEIEEENDEKDPEDRVEDDESPELRRPSPSKETRKQSNSLGPPKIKRFISKKIEEEPI